MQPIHVTVTLNPDGNLGLQSNAPNLVMLLGILEMAKAAALQQNTKPQSNIVLAEGMSMPVRGRT